MIKYPKPKDVLAIYDAPDYCDRYTIVCSTSGYDKQTKKWYKDSNLYPGLGMNDYPTSPQGFSQSSDVMWDKDGDNDHLGIKISWNKLPENVRSHIIYRLRESE